MIISCSTRGILSSTVARTTRNSQKKFRRDLVEFREQHLESPITR